MTFNLYVLGTPNGQYDQFPNDYTVPIFSALINHASPYQLVIVAENGLLNYVYTENRDGKRLGFAIQFNGLRFLQPNRLISVLHAVINRTLIDKGKILTYLPDGNIDFNIASLHQDTNTIEEIKTYLDSCASGASPRLAVENFHANPTLAKTHTEVGTLSDAEILDLMDKYHKIVITDKEVKNELTYEIISSLREKVDSLDAQNKELQLNIVRLSKQKKQYKRVIFLFFFLLLTLTGGAFVLYDLIDTRDNLDQTKDELHITQNKLKQSQEESELKSTQIDSLCNIITTNEEEYEGYMSKLSNIQPLLVTNVDFSFSSGELSLRYEGLIQKDIDIVIRIYYPGGNVATKNESLSVEKGEGYAYYYINNRFNSSKYYTFEILYRGNVIGGVRK